MAPLLRDRNLFTARWQSGLVPGQDAAHPATVKVFTRNVTYTNNLPVVVETQLYSGTARVQPVRTPRRNPEVGDTREDQMVRFQLKLNSVNFSADTMFVRVLTCPLNPALVNGDVYALREVTDSSNPIERTFEAVVDVSG